MKKKHDWLDSMMKTKKKNSLVKKQMYQITLGDEKKNVKKPLLFDKI